MTSAEADHHQEGDLRFYQALGRRIRLARTRRGLSQSDLAELIGYNSPTTLSYYETGIRKPNLYALRAIALALGVPFANLLDINDEVAPFFEEWDWLPLEKLRVLSKVGRADLLSYIEYLRWRDKQSE